MRVGDLVIRKVREVPEWGIKTAIEQRTRLGHGVILSKHVGGNPAHPCITVYYPMSGKIYDIAEKLMEVIGGSR